MKRYIRASLDELTPGLMFEDEHGAVWKFVEQRGYDYVFEPMNRAAEGIAKGDARCFGREYDGYELMDEYDVQRMMDMVDNDEWLADEDERWAW